MLMLTMEMVPLMERHAWFPLKKLSRVAALPSWLEGPSLHRSQTAQQTVGIPSSLLNCSTILIIVSMDDSYASLCRERNSFELPQNG
jgi:hypothetical protein